MNWKPIETCPEGVMVMTKIDDGDGVRNEAELIRFGSLFFTEPHGVYVYYQPTHWADLS